MNTSHPKTICVHTGTQLTADVPATVSPIYPGTSYAYLGQDLNRYPRYFNTPNQSAVVQKVCALEHASDGLLFGSGMAAISTTLLALLNKGDHAVFQKELYGGTSALIRKEFPNFGLEYTYTKREHIDAFEQAIQPNTRLIFIETPSNPLLTITDIKAVAELAKSRGIITIIDNTFASPINQTPIDLGIDIVMHSATKYLGGHSDICAGIIVGHSEHIQVIRAMAAKLGGSTNAYTSSLLERSIKTLAIRVKQQNQNALQLAQYLSDHPKVAKVYYPGLENHSGHAIAKRQMHGFGGMLSFELIPSLDSIAFQQSLKMIAASMSLGSVESTICSPALTSHAYLSKEQRMQEGISDGLLRFSVGIEAAEDLIYDLQQAF